MSGLRVALLTDSNVFAGTERHMLDLADGLRGEGVIVSLANPAVSPLAERAAAAGIPHIPVEKNGLVDWAAVRTLSGLLRSGQVDILHSHNGRTALSAAMAVRRAGRGASVASQHFLEPGHLSHRGPKALLFRLAHRWVDRNIDHTIAVSHAIYALLQEHNPLPADRVTIIPNGLRPPDPHRLTPPARIREALGVSADTPLIVCVARLESEKDVGSLIRAMAEVKTTYPRAVCVVAGDGSLKAALEQQITGEGMGESVRLLGFRADALALIQAGDLFVLPSLAEPFGLVLLEAMSLSKPVIATNVGGPPEIVAENETGCLVPPGQPHALAAAIKALLASPERASEMGRRGQARFTEKFTAVRMAKNTLAVYEQVLQKARK